MCLDSENFLILVSQLKRNFIFLWDMEQWHPIFVNRKVQYKHKLTEHQQSEKNVLFY